MVFRNMQEYLQFFRGTPVEPERYIDPVKPKTPEPQDEEPQDEEQQDEEPQDEEPQEEKPKRRKKA